MLEAINSSSAAHRPRPSARNLRNARYYRPGARGEGGAASAAASDCLTDRRACLQGTGHLDDNGSGDGLGYAVNFPVRTSLCSASFDRQTECP